MGSAYRAYRASACPDCGGEGRVPSCPQCEGAGRLKCDLCHGVGVRFALGGSAKGAPCICVNGHYECATCSGGTGRCGRCAGTGMLDG